MMAKTKPAILVEMVDNMQMDIIMKDIGWGEMEPSSVLTPVHILLLEE